MLGSHATYDSVSSCAPEAYTIGNADSVIGVAGKMQSGKTLHVHFEARYA